PQPRDAERDDDQEYQAEEPELSAREGVTDPDAEVPAEQLRLLDAVAERLDRMDAEHAGVAEPDRLDAGRQGQRDDAQRQGAQSQGRQSGHHPDERGRERGDERGERERNTPTEGQVADHERPDARERELGE